MAQPAPFVPLDPDHLAALAFLALLALGVVLLARLRPRSATNVGRALGLALVAYPIVTYGQKGFAGELSWQYSLPLELCHWVMFAGAWALFRPGRLASEIAYFWGLAGTLQATLTPEIGTGFPSWEFVLFFWGHGAILVAIVFLIAARGFRPRPGSVWRMLLAVNVYAAVVGAIDLAFGWNYGYLCHKPVQPSLLDLLGPWPWYLASLELIALASFSLLALPWTLARRRASIRPHPQMSETGPLG